MKHTIGNITRCTQIEGHTVVASGEAGRLDIQFLLPRIVHISYRFDAVPTDPDLLEASAFMTEPSQSLACEDPINIEECGSEFVIDCGETRVLVEKCFGSITVLHGTVVQHGGHLGTADTVIPDYQLRCIRDAKNTNGFGRFNFPLDTDDAFYGLGDKTGLPNRRGRRFSMFNRDSLGYDAAISDPLYKSIPFFIKSNVAKNVMCGLFFDHPNIACIDLGRESPFYYSIEMHGSLFSYYVLLGPTYKDVMNHYYKLTGFPSLPPLFSFGFFGSSMNYMEPDDARQRVLDYFATVEKYQIPCEGMYVSSGYLKASDGKRYAFFWNKEKFPDHRVFLNDLARRGYNLCMNIKPGILTTHPWYGELNRRGYFIEDGSGNPYTEFFWGGEASLIDFSNPEATEWWKRQLKEQYIDHGCTGIWNDNNEFEIEDTALPAYRVRSLYPVRMAKASYEVFQERHPHRRPWIYSRSGYSGLQRFARTWSGDNVSDWKTLRFNQYMGVGFGLSGLPYFGHDLGGFFGDFPGEELLVRSCQSAVFQGRFAIHSWRENGNPTEPWSYPSALPAIKRLIEEHYRFMPYIYQCAIQAALTGVPLDRMLKLEFPDDPSIAEDEVNMLFGDHVLKIMVTEPGMKTAKVYLPMGVMWYDGNTGELYHGGDSVTVRTPCDGSHQWFAMAGCAIPTSRKVGHLTTALFEEVDFLVFPAVDGERESWYREDDGTTELAGGLSNQWKVTVGNDHISCKKVSSEITSGDDRVFRVVSGYAPQGRVIGSFDPDTIREGQEISFSLTSEHIVGERV